MSPARTSSPRRGEIWTVDFGEPVGHGQAFRRPAVIVSSDRLSASRAGLVMVVPLTRAYRGLPSHIEVGPEGSGLAATSYAKTEDVKSVSVNRLTRRLGQASPTSLHQIGRALALLLELA